MIAIILHYTSDYEPGPRVWGPFENLDVARNAAAAKYGLAFPPHIFFGRWFGVLDDNIEAISFETMLVVS